MTELSDKDLDIARQVLEEFHKKELEQERKQKEIETRTFQHLVNDNGCVLAATPGAGKTNMAINIIKEFIL